MIRVRSADVWFNAPGIVCAYQPIAAPNSLAARQNVGNDLRMTGRYTARPGVLPTHNPRTGWTFNGSGQYLTTGYYPPTNNSQNVTSIVRISDAVRDGALHWIFGSYHVATHGIAISPNNITASFYNSGSLENKLFSAASAVLAVTGDIAYINGVAQSGTISVISGNQGFDMFIGARNSGAAQFYYAGNVLAFATYNRRFTPAEMWLASRQMAYCHVNPDWSAWGRRRRYYYAPSAAGFQAAWAARANRLLGGGADRV